MVGPLNAIHESHELGVIDAAATADWLEMRMFGHDFTHGCRPPECCFSCSEDSRRKSPSATQQSSKRSVRTA